jgi:hypothetical protein
LKGLTTHITIAQEGTTAISSSLTIYYGENTTRKTMRIDVSLRILQCPERAGTLKVSEIPTLETELYKSVSIYGEYVHKDEPRLRVHNMLSLASAPHRSMLLHSYVKGSRHSFRLKMRYVQLETTSTS